MDLDLRSLPVARRKQSYPRSENRISWRQMRCRTRYSCCSRFIRVSSGQQKHRCRSLNCWWRPLARGFPSQRIDEPGPPKTSLNCYGYRWLRRNLRDRRKRDRRLSSASVTVRSARRLPTAYHDADLRPIDHGAEKTDLGMLRRRSAQGAPCGSCDMHPTAPRPARPPSRRGRTG